MHPASIFLHLITGAVAITALVLAIVLSSQTKNDVATLRTQTVTLETTVAGVAQNTSHDAMSISLLQSQVFELMMHETNITVLQEGTFQWGASGRGRGSDAYPSARCYSGGTSSGFSIVAAGTNYRVGDLIRIDGSAQVSFFQPAMLKVVQIGTAGDVLAFDILTPGCLDFVGANDTMATVSVVGSGFTVQTWPRRTIQDVDYTYPWPPRVPLGAPQVGQYSLKQFTVEAVAFTVLVIEPPEFPISASGGGSPRIFQISLSAWSPPIFELDALGYYQYLFPLTQKNLKAINLTDDAGCYAAQTTCFMDAETDYTTPYARNAVYFLSSFHGNNNQIVNSYIDWAFNSQQNVFNYAANHANFTLNQPFMFLLTTL